MGFFGLDIGKNALMAQQSALSVVGQNIANASTEGYSRQLVNLESTSANSIQYGTIGTGVELATVNRARNEFLDDRIINSLSEESRLELREQNLESIQYVFNEPDDGTIRDTLDGFWASLNDLALHPENSATRETVLEKAEDLTDVIKSADDELKALRNSMNESVKVEVASINTNLKKIADLNKQISGLELDGKQSANDLKDKRDLIVEELAKSIDITVNREDTQGYSIVIDGRTVVQRDSYQELDLKGKDIPGVMYEVIWSDTGRGVSVDSGKLKGYMEIRDEDSVKYMEYLDQMAIGIMDTMNDANMSGFDINGQSGEALFTPFKTTEEIVEVSGSLRASIYNIHGTKVITDTEDPAYKISGITAGAGEIEINNARISYNTSSDSMADIINRINDADTGVVASLDGNNRLVFRGDKESEYTIRTIKETSGTLLQDLGIFQTGATEFNYMDTTTIANISTLRMNVPKSGAASRMEVRITDVDEIAAAKGKDTNGDGVADTTLGVGNGDNATAMAKIKTSKMIGNYTAEDYFETLVADLAVSGAQATTAYKNQKTITTSIEQRRMSETGVSMDEELTDMITYQNAYNAAAKYISTVDEMLATLLDTI